MRYEHQPRPEVEHHHHVRELIEQQDRRARDRQLHRDHQAAAQDRARELSSLQGRATLPFWCAQCREEFHAETILEAERDWDDTAQQVAFYRAKCPRGHRCIRLGSDKHRDPYYERAPSVARDRGEHAADTLQPWQSGYDMLYRNKNKHRQ